MKKALKRSLSLLLAITIIFGSVYAGLTEFDWDGLFAVEAQAANSGSCGENLTWTLDDEGTLTISGTGDMTNYYSASDVPWYSVRSLINSVVINSGVTNIGDSAFNNCTSLSSIIIPDSVTSIGNYALCYCPNLDTITIPDSVTSIGEYAFNGCTNLTSITIPDSVTGIGDSAFYNCPSLTSITIPDSVTSIGDSAFRWCESLTSATIGNGVRSIGSQAFDNCDSLTSITVDSANACYTSVDGVLLNKAETTLIQYPAGKTNTSYIIPDTVTSIGSYAFCGSYSLISVTIPGSVMSIGNYAFGDCTNLEKINWNAKNVGDFTSSSNVLYNAGTSGNGIDLVFGDEVEKIPAYLCYVSYSSSSYRPKIKSVTVGNSVTSIGEDAFYFCTSLTSVTIPDSVTSIGEDAFSFCTSLTSVTIPDSVTSIGSQAFYNCKSLTSITVDSANACYTSVDGVLFNKAKTTLIQYPAGKKIPSYTIPDGVTSIDGYAFSYCTSLTSVIIPDSVTTSIEDYAFYDCTSLEAVTIGNGVTSIPDSAFSWCKNLTSITISDSVTSISEDAFFYTGYYNNSSNWENDVLYIGNHLIEAKTSISGIYEVKAGTKTIADSALYNCTSLTSIIIPDSVTSIGDSAFRWCESLTSATIGNGVRSIDCYAFSNCTSLTSVTIPDSTTNIGAYAFYYCDSLASVTIGNGVTSMGKEAFYNCKSLEKINWNAKSVNDFTDSSKVFFAAGINGDGIDLVFGDGVEKIPAYMCYAYYNNEYYTPNVKTVTISDSVTGIGSAAFTCCSTLTSVYITDIASWCGITFSGYASNPLYYAKNLYLNRELVTDLVIPEGVTAIPEYAFSCKNITSATIPDSVTSIGASAFYNCTSLESVTIGNSVTSIGASAFYNCTSLESVTIPDSVTSIGGEAFYNCISLESVTIGNGVTSIGIEAFYNCTSLTAVYLNNITAWCGISFRDSYSNPLYWAGNLYLKGELVTDLVIPDGVTSIGAYAFRKCTSVTAITIPDSVTHMGGCAFDGCSNLTTAAIPNSVTSIVYSAFSDCTSLASVTIPDSVTSIEAHAFNNCTSLTTLVIPDSVECIGDCAFYRCWALKYVFYTGQQSQWENILTKSYNTGLADLPVHFGTTVHIASAEWENGAGFDCVNNDINYKHKLCMVCGYIVETKEVFTDGHSFVDGICEYCGVFLYSYSIANNEATVTGYIGSEENLIIPSTIEGYPVTGIGESAFINNTSIKSVVIPEGVTVIGNYAFDGCFNLATVELPTGVTSIGDSAFASCQSLTAVTIPDSVTSIGEGVFFDSAIEAITIPDSVTYIGENAFDSCNYLKKATIGSGLKEIPEDLFSYCSVLVSVVIDASISKIHTNAFNMCSNLSYVFYTGTIEQWEAISIEPGNKSLTNAAIHYGTTVHIASEEWENSMDFDCESGESGTLYKLCKYCECVVETKELSPGHKYDNSICSICGYCEFLFEVVDGNAEIVGYDSSNEEVIIPSKIGDYPVTSIYENAFSGCLIKSVIIPDTVTSIGSQAFDNCDSLTSITVDSANACYTSVDGVLLNKAETTLIQYPAGKTNTSYIIPDTVTSIGSYAFCGSYSLISVTIPGSVMSIGNYAFSDCTNLEKINWNAKNVGDFTSSSNVLYNAGTSGNGIDLVFGDEVEIIPAYLCYISDSSYLSHKLKINSVTVGNSVTQIGSYAFHSCYSLASVTIGNGVTSIGASAFYNCTSLESVTIGNSVTSIGASTFYNCTSLESVTIPDSVTSIGTGAFNRCTNINSVYITDVESWCSISFASINFLLPKVSNPLYYAKNLYLNGELVTDLVVPDGVKKIESYAFCKSACFDSVTIPDSVERIGDSAFRYCTRTKSVLIPESITVIGENAFSGCDSMVIFCQENSKAHAYADSNSIPYILNSSNTKVDLESDLIYTDIFGGILNNIIWGSKAITCAMNTAFAGTGTLVDVLLNGEAHSQYTLVVNGDINGDSVCDALDAWQVGLASNGHETLDGAYAMAADSNSDDIVDINDYQSIVNKVVA